MKFFTVFGVLCLVALSTQVPQFENCDEEIKNSFDNESCMHVVCNSFKNETTIINSVDSHSCGIVGCENGKVFKGQTPLDFTKVYPECCPKPICE